MINKYRQKQYLMLLGVLLLAVSMMGCSGKKSSGTKKPAEPTRKPLESLEDSSANLGQWGRAMGSVLIAMNEGDVYYFGGYEQTEGNKEAAARILKQSWKITNRTELLTQIQNLLTTGDRKEYRKEAGEMKAMSKKQLKTAFQQLSGETLTHYRMVQYNWKTWKKKGLLAWDMCRVSHLAQWGYVAGYITIEEAQALIEPAARTLSKKFNNWEDVQKNWLDGYAQHATLDAENPVGTDLEVRQKKYEELKKNQRKNQPLYDDSLFGAEILPLSGVNADTLLAEVTAAEDAQQKDITQKDTTQKDTTQKDTTQKDTTQKDTTQKDTTQKDTKQEEDGQKGKEQESAKEKESFREEN